MGRITFHTPIETILLVVIHSSKNKTEKVDSFAVINFLMEFSLARWQTILKFNNTVYGRSLIVNSYV